MGGNYDSKCIQPPGGPLVVLFFALNYAQLTTDWLTPRTELFLNAPHETISYLWQVLGCFHSLQPTENSYEPPSVPALTLKGFVRWESIQILLSPEDHVPFIISAVQNWNLKNPDTGEPFPKDISPASFPSEPDADICSWHELCGEKMRQEAEQRESPRSPRQPFPSAADRVNAGFSHVPAGSRGTSDYFTHRGMPFTHVAPGDTARHPRGARVRISPDAAERTRHGGISPDGRSRRRSLSDFPSPHDPHSTTHLDPSRPSASRRHSHPRRRGTDESDSDADVSPRVPPRGNGGPHVPPHRSPKVFPRYVSVPATGSPGGPPSGAPSGSPSVGPIPSIRTEGGAKLRSDERASPVLGARRKSGGFDRVKDWAGDKISGFFPSPSPGERPRKSPGSSSGNMPGGTSSRDSLHLNRHRSYDDEANDADSEHERERERRRAKERKRDRERERERERDRPVRFNRDDLPDWEDATRDKMRSRRDRERDRDREARYFRRPDNPRRTSSHADVDRLDRDRHRYDMEQQQQQRERYMDERNRRSGGAPAPLDDRFRDRTASPGIKGVRGRRYPGDPPWTQENSP